MAAAGAARDEPSADNMITAKLTADATSAREARAAVRRALTAWGMDVLSEDAELLASELVANAAEHGNGSPIRLALHRRGADDGPAGLLCEVSDGSPLILQPRSAGPNDERGRGLAIVAALASDSGVRANPDGKTTWFALALRDRASRLARQPEVEPEAGA